jgi:uncharacterized protein involved in response to NO
MGFHDVLQLFQPVDSMTLRVSFDHCGRSNIRCPIKAHLRANSAAWAAAVLRILAVALPGKVPLLPRRHDEWLPHSI